MKWKKLIVSLACVACLAAGFVVPASAAGIEIPIFLPVGTLSAYKIQYKTVNGEQFNTDTRCLETGRALRLTNMSPIPMSLAYNTPVSFTCTQDFWDGYNIDPNATYSGDFWISVEQGASEFITSSSTLTIGNLSFPNTSTDVNPNNKNRNFFYHFSFKGSDLVKKASNGTYFSVTFTISKTVTTSYFSIWGALEFYNFTYTAGTPGADKVTSAIDGATDKVTSAIGGAVNEDFGYSKPSTPGMDEGLNQGNNLLEQMTDGLDDFNSSISANSDKLIESVQKIKPMIDGVFNIIPLPVVLAVAGVVVFIVIRKVVGR